MTTPTTPQDLPIPAGFTADAWQDDAPMPYRILFGQLRNTGGVKHTTVQATAVQFTDGRIDDGSVHEPPRVYLGDDALTSAQARELAAALTETAASRGLSTGLRLESSPLGLWPVQKRRATRSQSCRCCSTCCGVHELFRRSATKSRRWRGGGPFFMSYWDL